MKYSVLSVLSTGIVAGKIHKMNKTEAVSSVESDEYEKLNKAIEKSVNQIHEMMKKTPDLADYLLVQEFMISDPELKKRILFMLDQGIPVTTAIPAVMKEFMAGLAESNSGYLKERTNDMEDAARRILMNLSDLESKIPDEPFILYTEKPFPSYLIHHKDKILGIISKTGGYTSHTAILCRGYDIPFVVSNGEFKEGEEILLDTRKKSIIGSPTMLQKTKFKVDLETHKHGAKKAVPHIGYKFSANAASTQDVKKAMEYGFDGIGLYRTEMIFMNSNRPFTAMEQYKIYMEAVETLQSSSYIVFRTFDVGGDKQISYVNTNTKGIDNYKKNPYIFENQVMALLKIYTDTLADIRIMFPMIFAPEEFLYLRDWIKNLAQRFNYRIPRIGMMLETKEALESIHLFKRVDFISIGTNDLVKSLYNLDRETSFDKLDSFKEDLLKRLKAVSKYQQDKNIPVSICGELASIPEMGKEFYKLGFKNLSVSPSLIKMLNQAYLEFESEKTKK